MAWWEKATSSVHVQLETSAVRSPTAIKGNPGYPELPAENKSRRRRRSSATSTESWTSQEQSYDQTNPGSTQGCVSRKHGQNQWDFAESSEWNKCGKIVKLLIECYLISWICCVTVCSMTLFCRAIVQWLSFVNDKTLCWKSSSPSITFIIINIDKKKCALIDSFWQHYRSINISLCRSLTICLFMIIVHWKHWPTFHLW